MMSEPYSQMKDYNQKLTRPLKIRKRKDEKAKRMSLPRWSFVAIGLLILAAITYVGYGPKNEQASPEPASTSVVQNGDILSAALAHFASEHDGRFPFEDTGPSATVEQCFQQLIDGGYVQDERVFWDEASAAVGIVSSTPPNNDGFLEPGENAWGYVKGLSANSASATPILFLGSRTVGMFDTRVFVGEKAIVAKVDGSVETHSIAKVEGASEGVILVDKEGRKVDIFSDLPAGAKIMVPAKFE